MNTKKEIKKLKKEIFEKTGCKIERLSSITNEDDYGYIYPEQIVASLKGALNLIDAKEDLKSRSNMIVAEFQSGKTSTMTNIVWLIEYYDKIREFLGIDFNSSIFITSMSDVANKNQLEDDIRRQTGSRKDKKRLVKYNLHNPDLMRDLRNNNFFISNGIIFNDESHTASFVNSVIHKWLKNLGINKNGLFEDEM